MPTVYGDGKSAVKYPFPHDPQEKKYYAFVMRPSVWAADTEVVMDESLIIPPVANGFMYECVSSGVTGPTLPALATVEDEETADNTAVFKAVPVNALLGFGDTVTTSVWAIKTNGIYWLADTIMAIGDTLSPTIINDYRFVCTVAGTTGNTEPTWDITSEGAVTVDGTAQFKAEFVGSLDNASIINSTVTRFRLTGVPKDATSIAVTNTFEVTRSNGDIEEFNRSVTITIKHL